MVTVRGRKKITPPTANSASFHEDMTALLLHTAYEDVSDPSALVSAAAALTAQIWAFHDTGATHHLFNDIQSFAKKSLKQVNGSNKRLKLAGGDVSLAVHSEGSVKLKASDGTLFELKECLYVPELSKNLLSGGRVRLKGVREHFDDGDNHSFSLVLNQLALFNGYIGANRLMNVAIDPVSPLPSSRDVNPITHSNPSLQHRRLGHIGNGYLKLMCKHESVEGLK